MQHSQTYYTVRTFVRIAFWVPLVYLTIVGLLVVAQ